MAEQYFIVYKYHIFIHSSVEGHLGFFHVLAAAINIGVHYLFELWFPPDMCPGVEL